MPSISSGRRLIGLHGHDDQAAKKLVAAPMTLDYICTIAYACLDSQVASLEAELSRKAIRQAPSLTEIFVQI